jgi:hypothetical protein
MQVAVIKDGMAHIHKVSVTRDLGTQVEVDDGVEQGDLVIINPPIALSEGSKARARAEPAVPRTWGEQARLSTCLSVSAALVCRLGEYSH